MATSLSEDLRIRVIRAVEGGMSRNAAARRFGVSITSAVHWMADYLSTGRTAPKPQGGDRRSGRIEAQAGFLMCTIEETPDITLAELRRRPPSMTDFGPVAVAHLRYMAETVLAA
jgi:transposase